MNFSCEKPEVDKLKKQILNLELINQKLRDTLKTYDFKSITDYQLTGFPVLNEYKVNKIGIINVGLLKYGEIRKYNVYQKIKGKKEKKLIYSDRTSSHFTFEFTPKSIDDNEVELQMEFETKGDETIFLWSKTKVNVIK